MGNGAGLITACGTKGLPVQLGPVGFASEVVAFDGEHGWGRDVGVDLVGFAGGALEPSGLLV